VPVCSSWPATCSLKQRDQGGDFTRNDEVYDRIEEDTRVARTADEMAAEASMFRLLFEEHERFTENDE
jgi:hypothetical protein